MSLSNLNLDAFMAIVKHRTVIEASKYLNITQTGVTQRIRGLERQLQTTLFIRTKKAMLLTDSGFKLLDYCQQKSILEKNTIELISSEGKSGNILLGIAGTTHFIYSRVIEQLKSFKQNYPGIHFNLQINDDEDKINMLKKNEMDFIFLPKDMIPKEFDYKILKPAKYVLVGPRSQIKNASNFVKETSIIDTSPQDVFTTRYLEINKITYDKSKPRHFINNTLILPKMVEQGLGVAILDEEHAKIAKKSFKIDDLFPGKFYQIHWAMVWRERPVLPKYYKRFIDLIY